MFIAIIGTSSSGRKTVLEYLIANHGFSQIGLESPKDIMEAARMVRPVSPGWEALTMGSKSSTQLEVPSVNGLSISSSSTPAMVSYQMSDKVGPSAY